MSILVGRLRLRGNSLVGPRNVGVDRDLLRVQWLITLLADHTACPMFVRHAVRILVAAIDCPCAWSCADVEYVLRCCVRLNLTSSSSMRIRSLSDQLLAIEIAYSACRSPIASIRSDQRPLFQIAVRLMDPWTNTVESATLEIDSYDEQLTNSHL